MLALHETTSPVRLATQRDEDELMHLCRRNHAENGIGSLNEDKVRSIMRRAFQVGRNDPGVIGVVGDNRIEGSICLIVEPLWYGDEPFLQEAWHFVAPEFRRSNHARDLIAFAQQMTLPAPVGFGVPLWIGITSTHRMEAKTRLYRKQLGDPIGVSWFFGAELKKGSIH